MRAALPIALVALILLPAHLAADLLIVEKLVLHSRDGSGEAVRSTSIKGGRMRIQVAQDGRTVATVYDLTAGETLALDAAKRRAEVRSIAARNAKLEEKYPRAATTVSITPKASTQDIAGSTCTDHALAVRVPLTKDGSIAMTLDGTACLAPAATGLDDYIAFAKTAYEKNMVLGPASDNRILLALIRGQTELYRALTQKGGIPLIVDFDIAVDGKGMLAGLLRKVLSGSRVTTVSRLDTAAIDDAMFTVPAGWKREVKK